MPLNLGDTFPDFAADTSDGKIDSFHKWLGNSWAIFFSHPRDYTPVCTTELGRVAKLLPDFTKLGVKVIALSIDSVADHIGWSEDIKSLSGISCKGFPYPIIADEKRELSTKLGMFDGYEVDTKGMPLTCRAVFIIGPDKKLRLSLLYPASTGRNFDEILRVIESLQMTDKFKVATPADWKAGEKCMVVPTVSDDDAKKLFPKGFETATVPSGKGYLRFTPDPR